MNTATPRIRAHRRITKVPRLCLAALLASMGLIFLASAPAAGSTVNVTNCNDSGTGSLRQTVASATSGETIGFALSPSCNVITLTSGVIAIATSLTISGPGANTLAVSGNNASTVILIDSGVTAAISGLTIEEGDGSSSNNGDGGGIFNYGTLNVTDSTFSGNIAYFGGGIFNDGTATVSDSTLSNNNANSGGEGGGIFSQGTLSVIDSTLSSNNANGLASIFHAIPA